MLLLILLAPQQQSILPTLLLLGGVLLVLYFMNILPQQRKQKEAKNFRDSLKAGMYVVTVGGLHGKIVSLDENTVTIQADKNVKLVFEKYAVSIEGSKRVATKEEKTKDEKQAETKTETKE